MKKKIIIVTIFVLILLLLIPIPVRLKDGGSIEFRAILYTVTKYHKLNIESETEYIDGIGIKILGIEVYNNTNKNVYTATDYAYVALEEILQDYTMEQAIQEECFVVMNLKIYNKHIYTDFISNVKNKKDAFIRAIYYTVEGDMIIKDVEYENDKNEFYANIGNTRDMEVSRYVFTNYTQESNEQGEYTYFENKDKNDKLQVLFCPNN